MWAIPIEAILKYPSTFAKDAGFALKPARPVY
jgi:hypothetical protein